MCSYINNILSLISLRLHMPTGKWVIEEKGMKRKCHTTKNENEEDSGDSDNRNSIPPCTKGFIWNTPHLKNTVPIFYKYVFKW